MTNEQDSLDEETGNVQEVNKVTGKADKIPAFMDDDKKASFVQKQLKNGVALSGCDLSGQKTTDLSHQRSSWLLVGFVNSINTFAKFNFIVPAHNW